MFQKVKDVFIILISALISSCKMSSGVAPFGMAMLGALSAISVPLIIPFIVISVITFACFGGIALLKFVVAAILFMMTKAFFKMEDNKVTNTSVIIFSTVIAEAVGLAVGGVLIYDVLIAVYTSIITGIFYLIFSEGIKVLYNIDKIKVYSEETLVATGVLTAVLLSRIWEFRSVWDNIQRSR